MGLENYKQFFLIVVFLRDSDTDTTPIDTRRKQIEADIWKALFADRTRGGNARDTYFEEGTIWDEEDGRSGGLALKISVDYATLEGNPYSKG